MGKILNEERFKHVDYRHTDLKATFDRVRKEQEVQRQKLEQKDAAAVQRLYVVYPGLRVTK